MLRKITLGIGVAGISLAMLPLLAAFEAHVVNVTARIENALNVPIKSIEFGTVFPQEKLDQTFDVSLSQSFQDEDRVDDVDYFIRQKPKCWNGDDQQPVFGQVTHNPDGTFSCVDSNFTILPLLCPYLSKHEITNDGTAGTNTLPAAGPALVNLGTAGDFAIIAETAITDATPAGSSIVGDIVIDPAAGSAITGVSCTNVAGTIYSSGGYTGGYNTNLACAVTNPVLSLAVRLAMETAYSDAAGRIGPDGVDLYGGNLGGQTFTPGLYKWTTGVTIPTNVTLSGGANDVWIFQIAGDLSVASGGSLPAGVKVVLTGGAQASNVFWQVGGPTGVTLGTYSTFNGTILSEKQVIIQTGTVLNGRAWAQSQVTFDGNVISVSSAPLVLSGENDSAGISAFHGPTATSSWTMAVAKLWDVKGHLAKAQQDLSDTWNIDLKVPCFGNHCAQDWADFVAANDGDNNADPDAYVQPIENEHKLFGCDLWLEVSGVSTCVPTPGGTFSVVSDTTNTVPENGNANAEALTFVHPAWTASIPGATWIWENDPVDNPGVNETFTFEKSFTVAGPVTGVPNIAIAADNTYSVYVNNVLAGSDLNENNFQLGTQESYAVTNLVSGSNTIKVVVTNNGVPGSAPDGNPAGVLYKLTYNTAEVLCSLDDAV